MTCPAEPRRTAPGRLAMKSCSASVEPTTSTSSWPKRWPHASNTAAGSASPDDTQSRSDERSKRRSGSGTSSMRAYSVATAKKTVGRRRARHQRLELSHAQHGAKPAGSSTQAFELRQQGVLDDRGLRPAVVEDERVLVEAHHGIERHRDRPEPDRPQNVAANAGVSSR